MGLENVISTFVQMSVTSDQFYEYACTTGIQDDPFVREVLHHLFVQETINAPIPTPEWIEEEADDLLELLKSPVSAEAQSSDDFEAWSPGFEAEVIMQEDIISVSLACLNDGEFR